MRTIKKTLAYCTDRKDSVNYVILKKCSTHWCKKWLTIVWTLSYCVYQETKLGMILNKVQKC